MYDIRNKIVIIAGSGSSVGIGRQFAEELLINGARLTIAETLRFEGEATARELKQKYGEKIVHFIYCDVNANKADLYGDLWNSTEDFFKNPVDVLINHEPEGTYEAKFPEELRGFGPATGTYFAFTRMGRFRGSGRGGMVINVTSVAGLTPPLSVDACFSRVLHRSLVELTHSLSFPHTEGVHVACLLCEQQQQQQQQRDDRNRFTAKALIELLQKYENGRVLCITPGGAIYWPHWQQKLFGRVFFALARLGWIQKCPLLKIWKQLLLPLVAAAILLSLARDWLLDE